MLPSGAMGKGSLILRQKNGLPRCSIVVQYPPIIPTFLQTLLGTPIEIQENSQACSIDRQRHFGHHQTGKNPVRLARPMRGA